MQPWGPSPERHKIQEQLSTETVIPGKPSAFPDSSVEEKRKLSQDQGHVPFGLGDQIQGEFWFRHSELGLLSTDSLAGTLVAWQE